MSGVEVLSDEARRLINDADANGIVLRAIGSVAVRLHCEPSSSDMERRERVPKDIDLVTRKRDRRKLDEFFTSRGYETDRDMLVAMEGTRYLFRNQETGIDVDVWVDELNLCHRLDIRGRLGSGPTLPIEDLLLSKLQIVELTPGDIGDIGCMLSTHSLGTDADDPEVIDVTYLTGLLGSDWGFWRTATKNMRFLLDQIEPGAAKPLAELLSEAIAAPKSTAWKVRSLIGDRKKWWQDVDIPRNTY